MASNTKLKWEQDLVEGLLEVVRNAARGQLKTTGPEPYLTKTDLRKLAYSLDEVKALVGQEFGSQVKTDPRSMWPFNDHTIKLSPNFEDVFRSILENDELKPRNDQKIKKLIKDAGGRPYNSKGYGGNDVGDAVVQPNKDVIATQIGKSPRTVEREIKRMVDAGILIPLKTARNEPNLYVIGVLAPYAGNNAMVRPFINMTSRRDEIRSALQELGF
jgi:hypothetical protein